MSETSNGGDGSFLSLFDPSRILQSMFVETDFESASHPDMEQMIASADPAKTEQLGDKLVRAAKTIDKIGQDLKTHAPRVAWEGEGADSFTTWSSSMSSATLRLGEFSKSSGEAMRNAAQTLREVKRDMPKYSESSKATLDAYMQHNPAGLLTLHKRQPEPSGGGSSVLTGPSQADAYDASSKLAEDHGEAARQMRKLAQSYTLTSMTMTSAEKPTFPPLPGELMPPKPDQQRVNDYEYAGGSHGGSRQPAAGSSSHAVPQGAPASDMERTGQRTVSPVPNAGGQVGTEIAGGIVVPDAPTTPPPSTSPPQSNPSGPPRSPIVGPVVPGPSLARPQLFRSETGRTPPVSDPSVRRPTSQPGAPRTGDPGKGIHGGRQTPQPQRQTPSIPRGNVIGADPAQNQQARAPMGRPGGIGGAGGTGAGGTRSPAGASRGLVSRPGGTFGGLPQRQGSATGRPFTPGGTGLGRGSSVGSNDMSSRGRQGSRAPMGGGRGPSAGDRPERRGTRPDYLVEDEDTWLGGRPRLVPPVID